MIVRKTNIVARDTARDKESETDPNTAATQGKLRFLPWIDCIATAVSAMAAMPAGYRYTASRGTLKRAEIRVLISQMSA